VALRKGADINVKNLKGNTPLHFCFQFGYGDSLGEYLISKGADATARNRAGYTCYEMAE
jgi:ankyrin repeat protein